MHSYEEDYCDALCPVQEPKGTSLLGEKHSVEPVTNQTLQIMHTSLTGQMKNMHVELTEEIKQNVHNAIRTSFEAALHTRTYIENFLILVLWIMILFIL